MVFSLRSGFSLDVPGEWFAQTIEIMKSWITNSYQEFNFLGVEGVDTQSQQIIPRSPPTNTHTL